MFELICLSWYFSMSFHRSGFVSAGSNAGHGATGGIGGCRSRKFYAVAHGFKQGIFATWTECQAAVSNCSKPKYKSFPTLTEAHRWLQSDHGLSADSYHVSKDCFSGSPALVTAPVRQVPKDESNPPKRSIARVTDPKTRYAKIGRDENDYSAGSSSPVYSTGDTDSRDSKSFPVEVRQKAFPSDVAGGYALLETSPPKNSGKGSVWTCEVLACDKSRTGLSVSGANADEAWRLGLLAALEAGAIRIKFHKGPGGLSAYSQLVRYLPLWRSQGWKTSKGVRIAGGDGNLERLYALLSRKHPCARGSEPKIDRYADTARRWLDLGDGPISELYARTAMKMHHPEKADLLRKRFLGGDDSLLQDHPPIMNEPAFSAWMVEQKRKFKSLMEVDALTQELFYERTEQHDPRWFEGRAYRGSASKAGSYTGSNKYEPFDTHLVHQTWEEYKEPDSERSIANMARGNLREPDARCRHREVRLRQIAEVEIPLAQAKRPGWKVSSVVWESYVGGVWLPTDPKLAGLACSDDGVITETWTWIRTPENQEPSEMNHLPNSKNRRNPFSFELDDRDDKRIRGTVTSLSFKIDAPSETRIETVRYLAEYKCPVPGSYERIPEYYADQVQYILGMRGLPYAHFGVWGEASFRFDRLDFDRVRFDFILDCMLRGQDQFFEAAVLKSYGISRYPEVSVDQVRHRLLLEEDEAFAEPRGSEEIPVEDCPSEPEEHEFQVNDLIQYDNPNQFVPSTPNSKTQNPKPRFVTPKEFGLI